MIDYEKPPLGLTPRQFLLKSRVQECIAALSRTHEIEDWEKYRKNAYDLARELLYTCGEWNKYYD